MSDRSDLEVEPTGLLPETAEPQEQPQEGERAKSARELAMEAIYAKSAARQEAEMAGFHLKDGQKIDGGGLEHLAENEPGGVYVDPRTEAPAEPLDAPEPIVDDQPSVTAAAPAALPPPETFAITVAGQQFSVTRQQMAELAQMGVLANTALHQYQHQASSPQYAAPMPSIVEPGIDDSLIHDFVERLQYGNKEEAAKAARAMFDAAARSLPKPQDPTPVIERRLAEERQKQQLVQHAEIVRAEFPDIFQDEIRTQAAATRVNFLRQRAVAMGQPIDDLAVYRQAGHDVRRSFGGSAPAQESPLPSSSVVRRVDVESRKRQAPRSRSQNIDIRSQVPEGPKPPTASEVVEWLRLKRGQPSLK